MNMNSGYSGYSKSKNAEWAEEDGRYPLTKSVVFLKEKIKKQLKINLNSEKCKFILEKYWNGEWHHSSKFCNEINYYDIEDIFNNFESNLKNDLKELENLKKQKKGLEKDVFLYIIYQEYEGSRNCGKYVQYSDFFKKINENWASTGGYKKNLKGNNILKIIEIKNFNDLKQIFLEKFKKEVIVENISAIKQQLYYKMPKSKRKQLEKIVRDNDKKRTKKAKELMKSKFKYKNFKQFTKKINDRFIKNKKIA